MNMVPRLGAAAVAEPDMRKQVFAFEAALAQLPQLDLPVEHYFANKGTRHGCYGRVLLIPAGITLVGKIHKTEQINILAAGDITVSAEGGWKRVQAPFITVSPAGTKRIGHAHADTVWVTMHATELTDLGEIEAEFIAQSEEEWLAYAEKMKGGMPWLGQRR